MATVFTMPTSSFLAPALRPERLAELERAVASFRADLKDFLPSLALLFDEEFYRSRAGEIPDEEPALVHYLRTGHETTVSPHPLFDAAFYLHRHPDLREHRVNPLVHYVQAGHRERREFHPLFDRAYYCRVVGPEVSAESDLLTHYLLAGSPRGLPTSPVFVARAPGSGDTFLGYLREVFGRPHDSVPMASYVAELAYDHPRFTPHMESLLAIFDLRHYEAGLRARGLVAKNPLRHALVEGAALDVDPSPMFDAAYYRANVGGPLDPTTSPLFHFVVRNEFASAKFHPLFEVAEFDAREGSRGRPRHARENPLVRYLRTPVRSRVVPTRLFDPVFYAASNPELDPGKTDLFLHYLAIGHRERRSPNAVFDVARFERSAMASGRRHGNALAEFAALSLQSRPSTSDFFDPEYYLRENPTLRVEGLHPTTHHLESGRREGRAPNALASRAYLMELEPGRSFRGEDPYDAYFVARERRRLTGARRPRVVIVGHDASRTGAPAIALMILRHLTERYDVECLTFLDVGGEHVAEFERYGHVHVKRANRIDLAHSRVDEATFRAEVDAVLALFDDDPPVLAICNSAEVGPYVPVFARRGIPTMSLIHEIAEFYEPVILERLVAASDVVVCPAQFVAERLRRWVPSSTEKIVTHPQGLLRENFGRVHWDTRERLLAPLGIGPDDTVVLACGTADGRKGIDVFVDLARLVRERNIGEGRVVFVWLGASFDRRFLEGDRYLPAEWDTSKFWAIWDCREAGVDDIVHFLPSVEDPEAYFACADLVVLTSRADPFPCVVHEAMACGLPVLAFEGSGGAPEALVEGAGVVVPRFDRNAMADRIVALSADAVARRAIGEAARRRVRSTYRFDVYVDRLVALAQQRLSVELSGRRVPTDDAERPTRPKVFLAFDDFRAACETTPLLGLSRSLVDAGHDVALVATRGRFGPDARIDLPGIRVRFLQPRADDDVSRAREVARFLHEHAPCIVVPLHDPLVGSLARDLPAGVVVLGEASRRTMGRGTLVVDAGHWNAVVARDEETRAILEALVDRDATTVRTARPSVPSVSRETLDAARRARATSTRILEIVVPSASRLAEPALLELYELARAMARGDVSFRLTMIGDDALVRRTSHALPSLVSAGVVRLVPHGTAEERDTIHARSHVAYVADEQAPTNAEMHALAWGAVPLVVRDSNTPTHVLVDESTGIATRTRAIPQTIRALRRLQDDPSIFLALSESASALVPDERAALAVHHDLIDQLERRLLARDTRTRTSGTRA